MALMNLLLALGLLSGAPEQAAPPPVFDLSVHVEMGQHRPGGVRVGSGGSKPLAKGQPVKLKAYSGENACGYSGPGGPVTAGPTLPSGAPMRLGTPYEQPLRGVYKSERSIAIGWQLDATPVDITPDHVVLMLQVSRETQVGNKDGKGAGKVMVQLRPGDAIPVDQFSVPDVRNNCNNTVGVLVLSLTPRDPGRAKVASTDLWLVHKYPGGRETTQHITVRSELNSPIPFFFDAERAGTAVLDVSGRLTLRPTAGDKLALEFTAERVLAGEQSTINPGNTGNRGGGQMAVEIAPDAVTSFEIPLGSGPGWEAFAGHSLSVRVKTKRMR